MRICKIVHTIVFDIGHNMIIKTIGSNEDNYNDDKNDNCSNVKENKNDGEDTNLSLSKQTEIILFGNVLKYTSKTYEIIKTSNKWIPDIFDCGFFGMNYSFAENQKINFALKSFGFKLNNDEYND